MTFWIGNISRHSVLTTLVLIRLSAGLLTTRSGLKDFEEWLLFVKQNTANHYFVLWLRHYNARYTQRTNIHGQREGSPQTRLRPPHFTTISSDSLNGPPNHNFRASTGV